MEFQSTPPVKAATRAKFLRAKTYIISIHAAREGGDTELPDFKFSGDVFQSTPPVKAAT